MCLLLRCDCCRRQSLPTHKFLLYDSWCRILPHILIIKVLAGDPVLSKIIILYFIIVLVYLLLSLLLLFILEKLVISLKEILGLHFFDIALVEALVGEVFTELVRRN